MLYTGYNPACGVCAMLRGGYMLCNGQNAITVSKQLDFKQQKQLKHPAMVPWNGDINKDAVHTLRASVHSLFFSNTSRQVARSKANFGNLSSFGLFSTFYTQMLKIAQKNSDCRNSPSTFRTVLKCLRKIKDVQTRGVYVQHSYWYLRSVEPLQGVLIASVI